MRHANNIIVASHTLISPAQLPTRLDLHIDVPSPSTGTGERILLDGRDVALLRASLVDGNNALVSGGSPARVTFRVLSGYGKIVGSGNGNPTSHERLHSPSVATFGGLARGVLQASADCASEHLETIRAVDVDGGIGGTTRLLTTEEAAAVTPILIEASATVEGPTTTVLTARIALNVSCDASVHGALAVARRYVSLDFAYLREFVG